MPPLSAASQDAGMAVVKILMLHGYTQSGPSFNAKTRALEKALVKALAPSALRPELIYPTGPNRLLPRDIPGYQPVAAAAAADNAVQPDTWAWFRKNEASGTYMYLTQGIATIAAAISDAGGVHAICGFSQGGAVAALVAAALEPGRVYPDSTDGHWARNLREANASRPLHFAVSYSGFFATVDGLKWCYQPKIKTPMLHYVGSLDTVVDESRTRGLIDKCEDPEVVVHPGGHFVPVAKEWVMPLVGFVKQHAQVTPSKPMSTQVQGQL